MNEYFLPPEMLPQLKILSFRIWKFFNQMQIEQKLLSTLEKKENYKKHLVSIKKNFFQKNILRIEKFLGSIFTYCLVCNCVLRWKKRFITSLLCLFYIYFNIFAGFYLNLRMCRHCKLLNSGKRQKLSKWNEFSLF